jgi:hypothetical protein
VELTNGFMSDYRVGLEGLRQLRGNFTYLFFVPYLVGPEKREPLICIERPEERMPPPVNSQVAVSVLLN